MTPLMIVAIAILIFALGKTANVWFPILTWAVIACLYFVAGVVSVAVILIVSAYDATVGRLAAWNRRRIYRMSIRR